MRIRTPDPGSCSRPVRPPQRYLAGTCVALALAAACGGREKPAEPKSSAAPGAQVAVEYPEPRFPAYLKPASAGELMVYARRLAQNRRGLQGAGFGIIEKGETVLWVASTEAEDAVLAALKGAVEERGGRVVIKRDYEIAGVPREEALVFKQDAAAIRRVPRSYTSEFGYREAANWVDAQFPDPAAAKTWLKGRRPDLHDALFPKAEEMTPRQREIYDKFRGENVGAAIRTYPNSNDKVFPHHNQNHPGYWWLYEIAAGTHPKGFRNPSSLAQGNALVERNRAGVFHWGLGVTLHHDPGRRDKSQKLLDFTNAYNLPRDHGWHTHTYFTTYKVRLRNANQWVTLVEKGRLASLNNPEVRALASRYGDPELLLQEDWRPNIPGVNLPGQYAEYAANPWRFVKSALDEVEAGTFPYFYPKNGALPAGTKAATP